MTRCAGAYRAFYRWLIFFGIVLFGGFVAYRNGLVDHLLRTDESYLSGVILALFVFTSLDAGRRARFLGRQLCIAMDMSLRASQDQPLFVNDPARGLHFRTEDHTDSYAHHHLLLLANKTIRAVEQDHAISFTGVSKGHMIVAGESILIMEVSPAAYLTIACNEALKAANVMLNTIRPFGATGRLIMNGPEAEIDVAAQAATAARG